MDEYVRLNKAMWDTWAEEHIKSDFYRMDAFMAGETSLKPIELALLGDVSSLRVLHLQCHFGQDSLSLARMGAQVVGADLSERAVALAEGLNEQLGLDARFVCCDLYELPGQLDEQFDIVFTSYGTIGWLPDLDRWAGVVRHFLKPGGRFVFAEFHPFIWMYDQSISKIEFSYFNVQEIREEVSGSYGNPDADQLFENISWNHPLSEVLTALRVAELRVDRFEEYDYSPYPLFGQPVEVVPGRWHVKGLEGKLPLVYALVATPVD